MKMLARDRRSHASSSTPIPRASNTPTADVEPGYSAELTLLYYDILSHTIL